MMKEENQFWHPMTDEPPVGVVLFVKKVIHSYWDGDYISYGTDVYREDGMWQLNKYTNKTDECNTPIAPFDVLAWAYIPK